MYFYNVLVTVFVFGVGQSIPISRSPADSNPAENDERPYSALDDIKLSADEQDFRALGEIYSAPLVQTKNTTDVNSTATAIEKMIGKMFGKMKPENVANEMKSVVAAISTTPQTVKKPVIREVIGEIHEAEPRRIVQELESVNVTTAAPDTAPKLVLKEAVKMLQKENSGMLADELRNIAEAVSTTPQTAKKPDWIITGEIVDVAKPDNIVEEWKPSAVIISTSPETVSKPVSGEEGGKTPDQEQPGGVVSEPTAKTPTSSSAQPSAHPSTSTVKTSATPDARPPTSQSSPANSSGQQSAHPSTSTVKTSATPDAQRPASQSSPAESSKISPENTSPGHEQSTEGHSISSSRPVDGSQIGGNNESVSSPQIDSSRTSQAATPSSNVSVTPSVGRKNDTTSAAPPASPTIIKFCGPVNSNQTRRIVVKTIVNDEEKLKRSDWTDDHQSHSGARMMETAESNPSEGLASVDGEMRPFYHPFVLPTMHVVRNTDQSALPTRIEPFFWYMPDYYSMSAIYPIFHRQRQAPSSATGDKDSQERRPRFSY